jgi:hypothetical protein
MPKSSTAGSYAKCVFNFLRKCQPNNLQRGYTWIFDILTSNMTGNKNLSHHFKNIFFKPKKHKIKSLNYYNLNLVFIKDKFFLISWFPK